MAVSQEYLDFVRELFEPVGAVRIRKMFGGAGVYLHDAMFALVADERLYMKVDDETRGDFEAEGLKPFVYEPPSGKTTTMSYYELPEGAYDDAEELSLWARKAVDAALRVKKKKR